MFYVKINKESFSFFKLPYNIKNVQVINGKSSKNTFFFFDNCHILIFQVKATLFQQVHVDIIVLREFSDTSQQKNSCPLKLATAIRKCINKQSFESFRWMSVNNSYFLEWKINSYQLLYFILKWIVEKDGVKEKPSETAGIKHFHQLKKIKTRS